MADDRSWRKVPVLTRYLFLSVLLATPSAWIASAILQVNTQPNFLRSSIDVTAFTNDRSAVRRPIEIRYKEGLHVPAEIPKSVGEVVAIKLPMDPPNTTIVFKDIGLMSCYKLQPPLPTDGQRILPMFYNAMPVIFFPSIRMPTYSILSVTASTNVPETSNLAAEIQCYPQRTLSEWDSFDHRSFRLLNALLSSGTIAQFHLQGWDTFARLTFDGRAASYDVADTVIDGGATSSSGDAKVRDLTSDQGIVMQWREPSRTSMRDLLLLVLGTLLALLASLFLEALKALTSSEETDQESNA